MVEDKSSKVFTKLFCAYVFTDVSLLSNDGERIEAHKSILSSFSSFFEKIFTNNVSKDMALYFNNISAEQLRKVNEFIYLGRCQVGEDSISKFLQILGDLGFGDIVERREDTEEDNWTRTSIEFYQKTQIM